MYKVFAYSPMFIPYGAYQTYTEAYEVVKTQMSNHFKMEISEEDENGNIINLYHFKRAWS